MRYHSKVHLPASLEHQAPRAPPAATDRIVQFFFVPWKNASGTGPSGWSCSNFMPYTYTIHVYFHTHQSFCHLRPQIAKARRGGRRGKVTAVITDNIVK